MKIVMDTQLFAWWRLRYMPNEALTNIARLKYQKYVVGRDPRLEEQIIGTQEKISLELVS